MKKLPTMTYCHECGTFHQGEPCQPKPRYMRDDKSTVEALREVVRRQEEEIERLKEQRKARQERYG